MSALEWMWLRAPHYRRVAGVWTQTALLGVCWALGWSWGRITVLAQQTLYVLGWAARRAVIASGKARVAARVGYGIGRGDYRETQPPAVDLAGTGLTTRAAFGAGWAAGRLMRAGEQLADHVKHTVRLGWDEAAVSRQDRSPPRSGSLVDSLMSGFRRGTGR